MDDARTAAITDHVVEVWQRRKWLAVGVGAVIFAIAVGVVTRLPDFYKSSATVLVERRQVAEAFVRPSVTGEVETRLQTISQEIQSRTRLEKVISRFGLYPERRGQGGADARMRKDLLLEFKGADHAAGRSTIAFTITYRGRDPETVAQVTNALAMSYVEENTKFREQQASGAVAFLRGQVESVKQRVDAQEQRIREFRARHAGELPQQMAMNLATLERLNAQIHLSSANQLRALDRRAQLLKDLAEADVAGGAGSVDGIMGRIAKLQQELLDLRRFSDKYPDVVRARTELAALEHDLAQSRLQSPAASPATSAATSPAAAARPPAGSPAVVRLRASLSAVEGEIVALKAEEQRLRADIAAYQRRAENTPARELELQELSRDSEMTKELYASLLKRYEDAQLAESMERRHQGDEFRLLDAALASTVPAGPNRWMLLIVGLIGAIGVAALAALAAEYLDSSFHTVGSLRSFVKVPILASIPPIVTHGDRRRWRWRFWPVSVSFAVALLVLMKGAQYVAERNDTLISLLGAGTLR